MSALRLIIALVNAFLMVGCSQKAVLITEIPQLRNGVVFLSMRELEDYFSEKDIPCRLLEVKQGTNHYCLAATTPYKGIIATDWYVFSSDSRAGKVSWTVIKNGTAEGSKIRDLGFQSDSNQVRITSKGNTLAAVSSPTVNYGSRPQNVFVPTSFSTITKIKEYFVTNNVPAEIWQAQHGTIGYCFVLACFYSGMDEVTLFCFVQQNGGWSMFNQGSFRNIIVGRHEIKFKKRSIGLFNNGTLVQEFPSLSYVPDLYLNLTRQP